MTMDSHTHGPNPYVGPRAFQTGEKLYGRNRDVLNLYYLLLSERVVLLFSPSGAGKTSLIQAGLIPRLKEKFSFIPLIRVNQELPASLADLNESNRYIFSTLLSLEETVPEGERLPVDELVNLTLSDYLTQRFQARQVSGNEDGQEKAYLEVLIFDQFEEILNTAPNDYLGKREFFDQLGEALKDNKRWALFSAREDYIAAFESYQTALPTRFANRYRLDLLEADSALKALQNPAREAGVEFLDAAARKVIDDLRRVQSQRLDGTMEIELGRYVEPVQLQVVCFRLWNNLPSDVTEITEKYITSIGSVDESLSAYYAEQVSAGEENFQIPQRLIREWFNDRLITKGGTRGQVMFQAGESSGLDNRVVRFMESAHLLRAEKRAGSTWFELAHDRLVEPIRIDNEKWFRANLSLLQQQANLWNQQNRPNSLLLRDKELADAKTWAEEHQAELLPVEADFLRKSSEQEVHALRRKRQNRIILILGIVAIVLGAIALRQSWFANIERLRARSGQLAAQSQALLDGYPQRSLLLAIEANSVTEQSLAPSEEALRGALQDSHGLPLPGHAGQVNALAFSADGRWLATGSGDGTINLWTVEGFSQSLEPQILDVSDSGVLALAFSLDGRWLAAGDEGGSAWLWDLESPDSHGHPVDLTGHEGAIFTLAFSPDGHWLGAGGKDGTARLWNLTPAGITGEALVLASEDGWIQTLAFSPDGKWLATGGPQTIWMWDLNDPDPAAAPLILSGHEGLILTLAFSPDGHWLGSGSKDGTARLWDLSDLDSATKSLVLFGHSDWVNTLAFSPDGRWLATGSGDNTARLWDLNTLGESLTSIVLPGHGGPVSTLAFSPDGKWLASGSQDHTVRIWDVNASAPGVDFRILSGHDSWVNVLDFNPNGRWLATAGQDGDVRLWDQVYPDPNESPLVLLGHEKSIDTLAFSPDGRWLATGSADHSVRLWDVNAENLATDAFILRGHTSWVNILAFSPDSRWLASGGGDQTALIWDLESAGSSTNPIELRGHTGEVLVLGFSPDGRWLATGSADHIARLWDLEDAGPTANPLELRGHTGEIAVLGFSLDGHWLATGSEDNTLRLWNLSSPSIAADYLVLIGHQDNILSLAFSPDGKWLASGSKDGTARLWDLRKDDPSAGSVVLKGHTNLVKALAFSPDGRWLATGSWDGTVRLWDMKAGDPAADPTVLLGSEDWVNTLAFSSDGRWLAAGGEDNVVRLWDLDANGSEQDFVSLTGHEGPINSLAFSPDGHWLGTGSQDSSARLWLVRLNDLESLACQSAGRNLTRKEWGQYFPDEGYHVTCDQWPEGR